MHSNKSNTGAFSRFKARAAAVGMSLAPMGAFAQSGPDVSAATGALADAGTAIAAIGVAMVAAAAAGIVYRWVTAFLVK